MATIIYNQSAVKEQRYFVIVISWIAISLIFFGIFAKDIVSFYFLDYSKRNIYGAGCVLIGLMLAASVFIYCYGAKVLNLLSNWHILSWAILLFLIAPLTAYLFDDKIYISPQAVGFAAAMACYLVSKRITKNILIVVLVAQFVALFCEYHFGFSITRTANEAQNTYFDEFMWFIDRSIGLIRAKGMLDSTHDSTWLYFYSALIFELSVPILVVACAAGWMAQGRLAVLAVGALALASKQRLRVLAILAVVALAAFAIYPAKMAGDVQFFLGAFDAQSSSNTYRVEATNQALDQLTNRFFGRTLGSTDFSGGANVMKLFVGSSGSALGSGTIATEMGYTLFALEYGVLGLALMAWTVAIVFLKGTRTGNRSAILFGVSMPILMFSSATQSASSFFMFWLAALFLSGVGDLEYRRDV